MSNRLQILAVCLFLTMISVRAEVPDWCTKYCTDKNCKTTSFVDNTCRCGECPTTDPHWCETGCSKKGCIGSDMTNGKCSCTDCNRDTSNCVFPFTYGGNTYHTCTEVESAGKPWCSTTSEYNGGYKYCDKKTDWCEAYCLGKSCKVFKLEGSSCKCEQCPPSDPHWCETGCSKKGCIGSDMSSGKCSCTDCNRDTSSCVFPFTYGGNTYYTCTEVESAGKPWCSTTSEYNGGYKYCEINDAWCVDHCKNNNCDVHELKSDGTCKCTQCAVAAKRK